MALCRLPGQTFDAHRTHPDDDCLVGYNRDIVRSKIEARDARSKSEGISCCATARPATTTRTALAHLPLPESPDTIVPILAFSTTPSPRLSLLRSLRSLSLSSIPPALSLARATYAMPRKVATRCPRAEDSTARLASSANFHPLLCERFGPRDIDKFKSGKSSDYFELYLKRGRIFLFSKTFNS